MPSHKLKHSIFVCLFAFCLATGAFAQWAATATQAIPLANATSLGALPSSSPMHVGVVLQLRNRSSLVQLVHSMSDPLSPLYGTELDPSQFVSTYGPTSSQVSAVSSYLQSKGLTNIQVESNNLIVQADGTAAQVSAAFNTQLQSFLQNGRTVFANTTPAQVPSSLSGIAVAVLGLNNAAIMQAPVRAINGVPTYPTASYDPAGLWQAYDVGSTPTGSATPIAIFAEGDVTRVISDFKASRKLLGLPVPPITVVNAGIPNPDTSGAVEWNLDTQASVGMAGNVSRLYMYVASSMTDTDLTYTFNKFVSQKLAKAGNGSFGLCEVFPFIDGNMLADDNIFLEAAAQGQNVFFSTGDTGSFCGVAVGANGVPAGAPFVEAPAASTYAIAVGGTTLLTNSDGSYNDEIAWYAGGGGISQFELSGYWQAAAVPSSSLNSKGLPDISMDADPNSGFNTYYSCSSDVDPTADCTPGWYIVGGTSLSSPLAEGIWARLQSAHKNKLGFAPPKLYNGSALATSTAPLGFHDVVLGANGLYVATPGWDYTTGLGTPDVSLLNALIH
jgi:subtilase family serine protease